MSKRLVVGIACLTATVAALALAAAPPGQTQSATELDALRRQVATLEQRVKQLEKRVGTGEVPYTITYRQTVPERQPFLQGLPQRSMG